MICCDFIKNIDAIANFDLICSGLKTRYNVNKIHNLSQIHSDIILVDSSGMGDGIIITEPFAAAIVKTADCLPVVLFDNSVSIGGIFHSGWRGTELGIVSKGAKMMQNLGCKKIEAVVFPAIGRCCFEIGKELQERFEAAEIPLNRVGNRLFADLKLAVINSLRKIGIAKILDRSRCSCCNDDCFSYRRDKTEKRNATFVVNFPQ